MVQTEQKFDFLSWQLPMSNTSRLMRPKILLSQGRKASTGAVAALPAWCIATRPTVTRLYESPN